MPANTKKILLSLLVVVFAVVGIVIGVKLVRESQELREEAAVEDGRAEVSLFPATGTFEVGDSFPVSVYFNSFGIPISGVSVRLFYPYSGVTPEFVPSDIEINSFLLTDPNWTCPTRNITAEGGTVNIDIACGNLGYTGFTTTANILLATFTFTVTRTPTVDPVIVRFNPDPNISSITRKIDGRDILNIPTSTGEYSVLGVVPITSPTATPTTIPTTTLTPTATLTPTLTVTPTATATPTLTATPTKAALPDAGVSYPTILGIGLGVLVILGAFILAL